LAALASNKKNTPMMMALFVFWILGTSIAMFLFQGKDMRLFFEDEEQMQVFFVLMAFLLYYRDWRVIVTATVVIAAHHFLFNYLQGAGHGIFVFRETGL
jgi:hypothetical protein